jgi:MoxR-like ATPase
LTPTETASKATAILDELERAVVGRRRTLELVLIGILAGGHVLLEDLPGLGKTLIARSFARTLGLDFTRIQFTPDLLPSDVVGAPLYDQRNGEMVFRPGPVFTQIEYEGTYELPEAQLDRFLMRLRLGYLGKQDETEMLQRRVGNKKDEVELTPVTDASGVLAMRESLEGVEITGDLLDYIMALVTATRRDSQIQVGASPRGGLALVQLARGQAVLAGRDYVIPDDIKHVAVSALAHRVTLRPELWVRQVSADSVVENLLASVPVPKTAPVV